MLRQLRRRSRRYGVAVVFWMAATLGSTGCATTWSQGTLAVIPPSEGYRVVGVTVADGETITFERPAGFETDEAGSAIIVGEVHVADNATLRTSVPVVDVELYWVEISSTVNATGVVVGQVAAQVAGAAILDALLECCN